MKLQPWICLLTGFSWQCYAIADEAVDAYRLGQYHKAAQLFAVQTPQTGDALYALAEMYLYGYGLPRDKDKALIAYRQAAEKNNLSALQVLARYELLVKHQPDQALQWFKKAAELQDVSAMMYMAAAYIFGLGTTPNTDLARKYYISAAKQGNPLAQLTLAEHFFDARFGKNSTLAWLWLNKACAQTYAPALLLKAKLLHQGQNAKVNSEEAQTLLHKVLAMNYLPALELQGDWEQEASHWDAAVKSYTLAVDRGYYPAELSLAALYAKEGTPLMNKALAFEWTMKAARHENLQAQKQLVEDYQQGMGVTKNPVLAQEWRDYIKKSVATQAMHRQQSAAFWLSGGQYHDFMHGDYALKGIWFDWHNPTALLPNHLNAAPKFLNLDLKTLFQTRYTMIKPEQISFMEYLDAIMHLKGPLSAPKNIMPHYGQPNQGHLSVAELQNLQKQAYLGVPEAQLMLGQAYLYGLQVKPDVNMARYWFTKAKDQDELRAQYELALLDLQSTDLQQQKLGLLALKDAAFKGNPHAEYTYGLLCEHGLKNNTGQDLLAPSLEEAKNMFRLAAVNESGIAKFRLAEWLSREPLSTLPLSERQAKQWAIQNLYQDAVKQGIQEAKLPLAFMMAASSVPAQRTWALKTATEYASHGDEAAALLVGLMVDRDFSNPKHRQEALTWYEKAKNHPIGGFVWASLLQDPVKAQSYLTKAAQAGFSYAYLNLAIAAHQQGQSGEANLKQAVAMGNFLASHLLANQLIQNGQAQDFIAGRKIFQALAEKGDLDAQTKLGYLLVHGLGGDKNPGIGRQWLLNAAERQYPLAQFLLGLMHHLGQFSEPVNDVVAKQWFQQAAQKMPMAAVDLGFVYETVDKYYDLALKSYQQVLPRYKLGSSYNLGLMYHYGKGMPVNPAKAQEHYMQAVSQGSVSAMMALGSLYLYQQGMQDGTAAVHWYQQAANHGQMRAWYHLGLLYETGLGASLDYQKAKQAYQRAAQAGDLKAQNALIRIQGYDASGAEKYESVSHFAGIRQFIQRHFSSGDAETKRMHAQLQYLRVLDSLNQGEAVAAKQNLMQIVKDYPHYSPAKMMLLQMDKQTTARR